jgi:hypothetical protein
MGAGQLSDALNLHWPHSREGSKPEGRDADLNEAGAVHESPARRARAKTKHPLPRRSRHTRLTQRLGETQMRLKEFALTGLFFGTMLVGSALAQTSTPGTRSGQASAAMPPLVSNARLEAGRWSILNPTGAAVAVYLGTAQQLAPDRIERVIRTDFAANNVTNVALFYEQNDVPGTGFSLHQNGNAFGPYRVEEVRQAIPTVAGQVRLVMEHPELAGRPR